MSWEEEWMECGFRLHRIAKLHKYIVQSSARVLLNKTGAWQIMYETTKRSAELEDGVGGVVLVLNPLWDFDSMPHFNPLLIAFVRI